MNNKNYFINNRGQSLVEYLVLVAIMAVASISVVRILNQTVSAQFAHVTRALQGDTSAPIRIDKVEESHYKKRDMSDFMKGAASPKRGQRGK